MTKLLEKKRGLIVGITNQMSICYSIAEEAIRNGAEVLTTYPSEQLEQKISGLSENLGISFVKKMNATDDQSIKDLSSSIESHCGKIDFIVHGVAFSDKNELRGRYLDTSLENFLNTMHVSCFSLVSLVRNLEHLLSENASILTLTYLGSQRVIPNYNVMGVAKSALECSIKYLANDLGVKGIRVNGISAGPIRTLASSGISDFKKMLSSHSDISPLKRNVTQLEVAKSAMYLLSDMSSGVTGEIHYVDSGYNVMGC